MTPKEAKSPSDSARNVFKKRSHAHLTHARKRTRTHAASYVMCVFHRGCCDLPLGKARGKNCCAGGKIGEKLGKSVLPGKNAFYALRKLWENKYSRGKEIRPMNPFIILKGARQAPPCSCPHCSRILETSSPSRILPTRSLVSIVSNCLPARNLPTRLARGHHGCVLLLEILSL